MEGARPPLQNRQHTQPPDPQNPYLEYSKQPNFIDELAKLNDKQEDLNDK